MSYPGAWLRELFHRVKAANVKSLHVLNSPSPLPVFFGQILLQYLNERFFLGVFELDAEDGCDGWSNIQIRDRP
jgi:hypothetical protein